MIFQYSLQLMGIERRAQKTLPSEMCNWPQETYDWPLNFMARGLLSLRVLSKMQQSQFNP